MDQDGVVAAFTSSSRSQSGPKTAKQKRLEQKSARKSRHHHHHHNHYHHQHHPQCSSSGRQKQRYHYAFTQRHYDRYVGEEEEEEEEEEEDDYDYFESYFESTLDQLQAELAGTVPLHASTPSERREKARNRMARMRKRLSKERGGSKGKGTELLVFTFFLVVMMLTLSQVLVVHHKYTGRYGQEEKPHSARLKAREEMRMVDRSISALRRQHIPSPQQAAESLQKHVYTNRIADLIQRASKESQILVHRRAQLQNSTAHGAASAAANSSSSQFAFSSSSSSLLSPILTLSSSSSSSSNRTQPFKLFSDVGRRKGFNVSSSGTFSENSMTSSSSLSGKNSTATVGSGASVGALTTRVGTLSREEGGGGMEGKKEKKEEEGKESGQKERAKASALLPPCPEEPTGLSPDVAQEKRVDDTHDGIEGHLWGL